MKLNKSSLIQNEIEDKINYSKKIEPTGFWTFFCNPKKWAIDDFLSKNIVEDSFSITPWQKDWFKKGQLGVIRVGHDYRNNNQLEGKKKLQRGIYAIVEVTGPPFISADIDEHYYEDTNQINYRVPIKYRLNLLKEPILLDEFDSHEVIYDKYLLKGFQASTMPLSPDTFRSLPIPIENIKGIPFEVSKTYTRKNIYETINVPINQQGGNWNTGYTKFNGDKYIFANINSAGRTGHNYDNKFIGDDFEWFGKRHHPITTPSIQSMINPDGNVYIFTREDSNNPNFTYQGNARVKEFESTQPVKIIWAFNDESEQHILPPEEIKNPSSYIEGTTKKISVNVYERNPIARKKCIDHYGCICAICNFSFNKTFGNIGEGFIHVHHLVELSEVGREYKVDPIKDLRPVCPNCHAMLHKRKPTYSINELKSIISKSNNSLGGY
ncbi:DUF3427 domain-containing protein [Guptibacillus hwajinpoensis]|uniref:DUF3427 domain-containing protein n=1 Tax=Guptibacillus hwajinpoensis TaxID=208199 RepID=UPI001CFE5462|nr:DUF3427 domain-containing protein [Pseudalkalibacillus hwajinpoensis]WLR60154.1 DUF3427 domain-containing protein [Pseudalkalibacillus hwajinpoensis]